MKKLDSNITEPGVPDDIDSEGWRYGLCENIYVDFTDIPRSNQKHYQKLSFSYKFRPEDMGKAVTFCYARPYGYSDLQKDLKRAK